MSENAHADMSIGLIHHQIGFISRRLNQVTMMINLSLMMMIIVVIVLILAMQLHSVPDRCIWSNIY